MSNPQLPQLTDSDGELLTPRELEPSELTDSDTYADDANDEEGDIQDVTDERGNAVTIERNPFRITRQLLFLVILVLWTAVFAVNGVPVGVSILLALFVTIIPRSVIGMFAPTLTRRTTRRYRREEVASEVVESKPDRIPHQLFYPLIVALWIGVAVVLGRYWPTTDNLYDVTGVGLESYRLSAGMVFILMLLGWVSVSLLVYVPAAIFDKLFPTSTRLTMTQTYGKSLKLVGKFIGKIVNAMPRRGW